MIQIKVEHTKPYQVHINTRESETINSFIKNLQVAESKLILVGLNTINHPERKLFYDSKHLFESYFSFDKNVIPPRKYIDPILISEIEKIEVGDWFFHEDGYEQAKVVEGNFVNGFILSACYKILALPEHFSPEQLQMIVDGELKDGEEVLVECEQLDI